MPTAPRGEELINESTFFKYVSAGQTYSSKKGAKSTLALNGQQQYAATTHSVSDILQGTLSEFNPEDELLIINKALTDQLAGVYSMDSDIHGLSSFTTTIPNVTSSIGASIDSGNLRGVLSGLFSNGWPDSFPKEGAEAAALAAYNAGFSGADLVSAVMIAGRESDWTNRKSTNSNDWGMWQINMEPAGQKPRVNSMGYNEQDLLNPLINAEVAYSIYVDQNNSFATAWSASDSSPYLNGAPGWDRNGDPFWHTEQFADEAYAAVQSVLAKLSSLAGVYGTVGPMFGGDANNFGPLVDSFDDIRYAGEKLANHPNFWMAQKGQWYKTLRSHLTDGFSPQTSDPRKYIAVWDSARNRGYYTPSLINYLWMICESGFILADFLGGYDHRNKAGGSSSLSNHAHGGAIDIGAIGTNGTTVSHTDNRWRTYNDQLWTKMATYPQNTKPQEVGSSFSYTYSGWFRVYKDPHPTHIHLGFAKDHVGQLLSVLKPGGITPSGFRLASSSTGPV